MREVKERVQRKLEKIPTKLEGLQEAMTKKLSSRSRAYEGNEPRPDMPPEGSGPSWEFGVRDGFCTYQSDCSDVLEEHYQAFCRGTGPAQAKVVSMGREIIVDFGSMVQQV